MWILRHDLQRPGRVGKFSPCWDDKLFGSLFSLPLFQMLFSAVVVKASFLPFPCHFFCAFELSSWACWFWSFTLCKWSGQRGCFPCWLVNDVEIPLERLDYQTYFGREFGQVLMCRRWCSQWSQGWMQAHKKKIALRDVREQSCNSWCLVQFRCNPLALSTQPLLGWC